MTSRRLPALALLVSLAAVAAAGCGGSTSATPSVTIAPAKQWGLVAFRPARPVPDRRPVRVSFAIRLPSGVLLTRFKRGAGPHTGVHLIFVRSDLAYIVHTHPPVGPNGRIAESITFPAPGRYKLIVDTYPDQDGLPPNFQLVHWVDVAGASRPVALPAFTRSVQVDGDTFTLEGHPTLRALRPAFLQVKVTAPDGKPATFAPWFGALAHAIFIRKGTLDYFHTHVCSPGATGCASVFGQARVTGRSTRPGRLTVGVLLPEGGVWRLFLQTRANGAIVTAPFTLDVEGA